MKKILFNILLALFVLFPASVLADGYVSVSPSSLTIEQGSSKTFAITTYNVIGDVSIKSNNSGIASVSTSEWGTGMVEEKITKTGSITVTGNSVGTTTITLTIDAATFDGDDLAGQTKTVTVNVVEKPTPQPSNPTPSNPQPQQPQKSTNNNLKNLSIDGFELVKVDSNNYTLTVSNDIDSINVNASAEDSKANVTGIGTKKLQVGENNIEVIITSESGSQNKINIKITRKDGYYLEDLDSVLKNDKIQDADIIINSDSNITKEQLNQIKKSKKTIRLNYFKENKKLLYSWVLNGKEMKNINEFVTTIDFTTQTLKEIYKVSNYADGLYINFKHNGNLPTGTKIKLYVGDKFENENVVNVYRYNAKENKLDFVKDNLKVTEGYIEFALEHCSDSFVTMSVVGNIVKEDSSINIFMILTIILIIVIIGLVTFIFIKLKPNKKDNSDIETPKTSENNSFDTFNKIESNQVFGTDFNNTSNINNSMDSFNDNTNEIQNLNNSNIDFSNNYNNNNNNLYK